MTYDVTIFGLHMTLNPVAFTIPIGSGWTVYWYGIIIAAGFLSAIVYAMVKAKDYNINTDRMIDVILVTTPVAILCARAYYCLFDGEKLSGIGEFFKSLFMYFLVALPVLVILAVIVVVIILIVKASGRRKRKKLSESMNQNSQDR